MANRFNITDITINSLQLRNMTEERIYIQDIDKQGIFEYDAADVSTPHDGIYVLVDASGRRYKKVTASLVGLKIPAVELPSYVDDVLEYANFSAFPLVGVSGIIYIAADTGLSYRWSGSIYALVAGGVASVNGLSGIVTLYTDNINENGSPVNLWYTEARVSANIDVAANTAARHAAMTISGGSSGFASLAGQVLTINQGGINYWVKATNDIYYSAGKVAIGTSTMAGALNILGNVGTNVGSNNFAWGGVDGALNNLNNNSNNIGIGSYAGRYANTASGNNGYNIILGFEAGYGQNGLSTYTNVNAIGYHAGYSLTTGTHNNLMGSEAGYSITTGSYINAFGQQAGRYNIPVSGGHNNLFGLQAGYGQNGLSTYSNVNAFGFQSSYSLTTGASIISIGWASLYSNTAGSHINALGTAAGYYNIPSGDAHNNLFGNQAGYGQAGLSTYTNVIAIGYRAGYSLTTGSNNFFAGNSAGYSATSSSDNIYIGQQAGYHSTGSTNIVMGFGSGIGSIGLSTYTQCNLMGYYVGSSLTTGSHINAIGQEALRFNTTGSYINAFGTKAGYYLIPSGNAHNNLFGYQAGYGQNGASTYTNVNAIGADSCRNLTTSSFINAIGGATCFNTTTGSGINALGFSALYFNQTGSYINAIGHNAGYYNIPSSVAYNDLIGYQAGYGQEGLSTYTNVIAIGYRAGYSLTTGSSNVLVGTSAGYSLTTGSNNFLVCSSAGYAYTTSSYNVAIGFSASRYNNPASNGFNFIAGLEAGYGQSGLSTYTNVIAIGYRAGYSLTTGSNNFFAGNSAGFSAASSTDNVFIGRSAGYYSTGSSNVALGKEAGFGSVGTSTYTGVNLIGEQAGYVLTTGSQVNAIGYQALRSNTTGSYINAIGYQAGYYNIPTTNGYNNLLGYRAGYGQNGLSTYSSVNALGPEAGRNLTTATQINAIGNSSAFNTTSGSGINAFGLLALYSNQTGSYINAIGSEAGYYNIPSGSAYNNLIGYQAGYGQNGLSTYTNVTAIGYRAGYSLTTGTHNNFFGNSAGYLATTVDYAINIGYQAGYSNSTGDDGICIGKNAGYYETNGARLYITNQQGTNLADGIAKAIIYGEMNATTSSQILYLNAGTSIFANALGVTQSTTRGLILENSTAAAAGAQQYSPAIRWRGFGWKTDTTAASQAVDFRSFIVPVQGTSAPTGSLRFESAINGGSYSEIFSIDSLGFSKDIGRKRVGTQFDKTTNTTLGDVTNLSVTVGAGDTYKFKAHLFVNADATGGSKYAVGGTATATNIIYSIRLLDDSTDAYTIVSRQTAIGGNAGQVGTTEGTCIIEGSIVVNAGGTLTVQFAQNASNATSSVLVGSTFEVEKI